MQQLQNIIETAFERRAEITPANADTVTREAVNQVIALLDSGALRVAEKIDGQWVTHQWLKKAVLLSFRINDNQVIEGAESRYFDKVPMKFADYDEARFQKEGFRVVPPAPYPMSVQPHQLIRRRDNKQRQQRCGDHAANHLFASVAH